MHLQPVQEKKIKAADRERGKDIREDEIHGEQ